MRWLSLACVVCLMVASPCLAQLPAQATGRGDSVAPSLVVTPASAVAPSATAKQPRASYEYVPQYTPAWVRAAEFEAMERTRRLSSLRWYGLSNSRPYASADPWHGPYSPVWTSGNAYHPYRWSGQGTTTVIAPSRSAP